MSIKGSTKCTRMRCYTSDSDEVQCQNGVQSCVTVVEIAPSGRNHSAGHFVNENAHKCGTSLVFAVEDSGQYSMQGGPALLGPASPMCDPDICEVVVEEVDYMSRRLKAHVIPFGPHPHRQTGHRDPRTVDPIWQFDEHGMQQPGQVFYTPERYSPPKCVPKNTATCINNFKDARVSGQMSYGNASDVCEATPGCTWGPVDGQSTPYYLYLISGYMNYMYGYMNYGSCQASNPKVYGTDKVMLVNASAMCVDAALTEDTGIVCDGPGFKITSTGRFAYECCDGDLCNKLNTESLQVQNTVAACLSCPTVRLQQRVRARVVGRAAEAARRWSIVSPARDSPTEVARWGASGRTALVSGLHARHIHAHILHANVRSRSKNTSYN